MLYTITNIASFNSYNTTSKLFTASITITANMTSTIPTIMSTMWSLSSKVRQEEESCSSPLSPASAHSWWREISPPPLFYIHIKFPYLRTHRTLTWPGLYIYIFFFFFLQLLLTVLTCTKQPKNKQKI